MNTETIKIKKLDERAKLPTHGSEYAAGWDLYTCIDKQVVIKPHETVMIGTGLALELPNNTFGMLFARSGMATKRHLAPATKVTVYDADYRGECFIPLHNHSDITQYVEPNERIAQLVVMPYIPVNFEEVDELSDTERGDKGFGDSGRF